MDTLQIKHTAQASSRFGWGDGLFAALMLLLGIVAFTRFHLAMNGYEQLILFGAMLVMIALGWFWKAWRVFLPLAAALSLLAIWLYQGQLAQAQHSFWLKYLLCSQSAIMWMCTLFCLATLCYWFGLLARSDNSNKIATGLSWSACGIGTAGLLTRWYESYLLGADIGHIPVSNLYEVLILFCLITALMYLYYQARYPVRALGALVLLVIAAAVMFIIWYAASRQAQDIQPLIPALQSWWMKIHVPANFIGYGAFSIAAMLGIAQRLVARGWLTASLPSAADLDEIMYRAISVGFLFFTIATLLGAMWAADAWGGYWSWDPKETWALIVWLNYAAWLHVRLVKGWRGPILAWWAIIGLAVTSFAFIGVNVFLSGLHSYGGL